MGDRSLAQRERNGGTAVPCDLELDLLQQLMGVKLTRSVMWLTAGRRSVQRGAHTGTEGGIGRRGTSCDEIVDAEEDEEDGRVRWEGVLMLLQSSEELVRVNELV